MSTIGAFGFIVAIIVFVSTLLLFNIAHPLLMFVAVTAAIPIQREFGTWFFGDLGGFAEDVKRAALPDLLAALKGRYWDGEWAEVKLLYYALLCFGIVAALYKLLVVVLFY